MGRDTQEASFCTRRPLAAKERVQYPFIVPPYDLYFRQLFARQQRFCRQGHHGIPGTTRVRKPLFAPFGPLRLPFEELRGVGGMFLLRGSSRQRSLGHSFSVPPVLDIFLS